MILDGFDRLLDGGGKVHAALGEISAITIERFRDRTDVPNEGMSAAIAALVDPDRRLTGPTRRHG